MTNITHNVLVRQYLAKLLAGTVTVDQVLAEGTEAGHEAVEASSRVFSDVTHAARDIYSAMTSPFEAKIKAGSATLELLYQHGLTRAQAMKFLGKTLAFKIDWEWTAGGTIYLLPLTRMPSASECGLFLNGLRIPLAAIVQNTDAHKCRLIVDWVNTRKTQ
ncbi:hypothetical protein [Pseudomonas phage Njord]|uniref:Uncharacterized protein n=1 Tax=Pseudomonas phage Njord TaxID=2163985 RepID=A0A2S1GMJ0_9CAUD|nr:hypothetical protein HOT08_gp08 [Pseudomonas phage Njord]AWD90596.1 hypothetical protein [Pseudomonas phage Njord]